MITAKEAAEQVERMSGLQFYPKGDVPALKELRLALECAASVAIAERVVSNHLGYQTERPTPAVLRAAVWEENGKLEQTTRHCPICEGNGAETTFMLVTYRGNSLMVQKKEIILGMKTQEAANEFAAKLPDNQTVLSGARQCACRKAEG